MIDDIIYERPFSETFQKIIVLIILILRIIILIENHVVPKILH